MTHLHDDDDIGARFEREVERIAAEKKTGEGEIRAEIARLAALPWDLYESERRAAARKLGWRVSMLDAAIGIERAKQRAERAAAEATKRAAEPELDIEAELKAAAGDLIGANDILDRFAATIGAVLVGDTANAKLLYLALTSRVFDRPDRPVSIAIKGVSSAGKSYTVEQVLKFFPPEAFFELTGMSEKALPYMDEDFEHRFIIVYEAAGINTDTAAMHVRTLLSENKLIYYTNESTPDGVMPRKIEKEGPTGLITTTTLPSLHPENETRLLSLGVVDTPEQTKAVMRSLARGDGGTVIDHAPWQAFQRLIAEGECRVDIPYASALAELIPPLAVRLRRDFNTLLILIRAHALLHREKRARDGKGQIVATLDDYAAIVALLKKLFAEAVEATVPKATRETVEAVQALIAAGKEHVSQADLMRHLKLDRNTVHHRVGKALAKGYLQNTETKRGVAAKLVLGAPLPEETEILPSVEKLAEEDIPPASPGRHPNTPTPPASDGKESGKLLDTPIQQRSSNSSQQIESTDVSVDRWSVGADSERGKGNIFTNDPDPTPAVPDLDDGLDIPPFLRRFPTCAQCGGGGPLLQVATPTEEVFLHRECERAWFQGHPPTLLIPSSSIGSLQ